MPLVKGGVQPDRDAVVRQTTSPRLGGTRGAVEGRTWRDQRYCPRHVSTLTTRASPCRRHPPWASGESSAGPSTQRRFARCRTSSTAARENFPSCLGAHDRGIVRVNPKQLTVEDIDRALLLWGWSRPLAPSSETEEVERRPCTWTMASSRTDAFGSARDGHFLVVVLIEEIRACQSTTSRFSADEICPGSSFLLGICLSVIGFTFHRTCGPFWSPLCKNPSTISTQ